jgi:hypothetical protein
MPGEPFKVDDLHAEAGKKVQDIGLGRAGVSIQHHDWRATGVS